MAFSGDMSSLKTIYTSAVHNNSKFVNEIYLYLAATSVTFSGNKKVVTKDPIQAPNISGRLFNDDNSSLNIISGDFGRRR